MHNFEMIHNGHVDMSVAFDAKSRPMAALTVNDKYHHTFPVTHPLSKALNVYDTTVVADRVDGGNFFIMNGSLVDYRDKNYLGFVHTNDNIQSLIDNVGLTTHADGHVSLAKVWSENPFHISKYNEGGEFKTELTFLWNPFHKIIRSMFKLERLICTNGMVGMTSLFNSRIPLVNRWQEHLNIASTQIQNKLEHVVADRLSTMGDERASVAQCMNVAKHAETRVAIDNSPEMNMRLRNIQRVADPKPSLEGVYQSHIFKNSDMAAQVPGHLTSFDVYNLITEVRTHTQESENSTNGALDRSANNIVFSNEIDVSQATQRYTNPVKSAFSDPEQAFFGVVH